MSREDLMRYLIEVGALKFGEFTLSSGKKSNVYIDIKHACTYPHVLKTISEIMSKIVKSLDFDKIACIELGGVPLAVALSLRVEKPLVIFRKEKKGYGIEDDCIGDVKSGERFVVVEDVTTTGRSALSVVRRVEERGGKVVAVLTVVDREEGAKEKIKNLIPILKMDEILEGLRRI
ncbi:MAG: orotate phosphoribosyltransferase [Archaeoglobales archaeon]|nr:MAG: orotate phosphoribosyltransferase [Archaeoglobales archaeon]